MNERIKLLASQAGVTYDWDPGTGGPEVYFDRQEDFEKFAELIVRECYALVDYENKQFIKAQFKEHFGVEE
jgi:hypothetical protein